MSDDHRRAWGCDEPTIEAQAQVQCVYCGGDGCDECQESGFISFRRCPRAILKEIPWVSATINYFGGLFSPHGLLPHAGGLFDQPATFVSAMRFLGNESARIQNEKADKARRAARRDAGHRAANRGH